MKTRLSRTLVLAAVMSGAAGHAVAQHLDVQVGDGRVTIVADLVPAREILAEWARIGGITLVNAEILTGPPLTLHLQDVPEPRALDTLLRDAGGYVASTREDATKTAASILKRVM